jgi:hypothetical protein
MRDMRLAHMPPEINLYLREARISMPCKVTSRADSDEESIPDWAPFAPISDAEWRDLQRRRNLVKMVRALAESARDEGFSAAASMLVDTADRIQSKLIASARTSEATDALLRDLETEGAKLRTAGANRTRPHLRAIAPNGFVKARAEHPAMGARLGATRSMGASQED